jgi:hypothetical protein
LSDPRDQAAGLVALLGWDWSNFRDALPEETDETLVALEAILREPAQEGEPEGIQIRADVGLRMIAAEQRRRKASPV